MATREFAHSQKAFGPPLFPGETFGRRFVEIGRNSTDGGNAAWNGSSHSFGTNLRRNGIESGENERAVHVVERCPQFDPVVVVEHDNATD